MRILHLVGRSHRRGAEQVAMELAEELDALGHHDRLAAVSLGHEGDRCDALPPLVDHAGQRPVQLLRSARRLRRDLKARPVDVILAHGAAPVLVAVLAAPRRGPALVWQTILGLTDRSFHGVLGACWRVAVRRVDGVVALTEELGDELRPLGYRGPVWRVPNARRTERFEGLDRPAAAERLRKELDVAPEVTVIGLVGFLVEQKRPLRAVEVLAGLRAEGVDVHLVVAGSGPLAEAVRAEAAARGVERHLSMLGHRDDVEQVLAGLDVLILTSDDEGIPGVLIEAAMAGCPVVTYPLGGVAEVVEHDVTGLVLTDRSVAAMVRSVAELVREPDRRARLGATARDGAERFSMHAVALQYQRLLLEASG